MSLWGLWIKMLAFWTPVNMLEMFLAGQQVLVEVYQPESKIAGALINILMPYRDPEMESALARLYKSSAVLNGRSRWSVILLDSMLNLKGADFFFFPPLQLHVWQPAAAINTAHACGTWCDASEAWIPTILRAALRTVSGCLLCLQRPAASRNVIYMHPLLLACTPRSTKHTRRICRTKQKEKNLPTQKQQEVQ